MKILLLKGNQSEILDVEENKLLDEVYTILKTNSEYINYHTFGKSYIAFWQVEREEKTSMEITMFAGASYPIFIDSYVVIVDEEKDIDMKDVKKYFNVNGGFWALMKN